MKRIFLLGGSILLLSFSLGAMVPSVQPAARLTPEWGYAERLGRRSGMEDAHTGLWPFAGHNNWSYFAVYDGHGGSAVAQKAAKELHIAIAKNLISTEPENALKRAFEQFDSTIDPSLHRSGAVAAVALTQDNKLYLAWAGDTRVIVIREGKVIESTVDHKPNNPIEKKRIESLGGQIWLHGPIYRVGGLAIARTLGDVSEKKDYPGIISTPDIKQVTLEPNDIVIIACDGLWDELSNEQVVEEFTRLNKRSDAELEKAYPEKPKEEVYAADDGSNRRLALIARGLRDKAYQEGSTDNISVMVVQFKPSVPSHMPKDVSNLTEEPKLKKDAVFSSLEALHDALINEQEKVQLGHLIGMLRAGYTKTTLEIVRDNLEVFKRSKVIYFGQSALAHVLIESIQNKIDADLKYVK
jgi:serine/threonine protein phosphatase PrpC